MITLELDEAEANLIVAALRWVRHNEFDRLADAVKAQVLDQS